MGSMSMLGGMAMVLAIGLDSPEAKLPYRARVTAATAEVRSGPSASPDLYATNQLRPGDIVDVIEQLPGGWLAIKPPPGSFSWINQRYLEQTGPHSWVVTNPAEVPILVGSSIKPDKPSVEGVKIQPGSQLTAYGKSYTDASGIWLPIVPPPAEKRYIQASQVAALTDPVTTTAGASPTGNADPLLLQAQQDEQQGRYYEASQLYTELGKRIANTDHERAIEYQNRAHFLLERSRTATVDPRNPNASVTANRIQPVPAYAYGTSAPCYVPQPNNCAPAAPAYSAAYGQTQQSAYGQSAAGAPVNKLGTLRLAGQNMAGKRAYLLVGSQGEPIAYVTGQPGVNLDPYVNQNVQVTGPLVYRMDVRAYHLTATSVAPIR